MIFEWYKDAMGLCFFIFIFLFRNNVIREQLNENDFCRCYVFFLFETIIPSVLDHNDVQCSLSTITRHLDNGIWKTSYKWRFYQHRSQACTKTFNLLLYYVLCMSRTRSRVNLQHSSIIWPVWLNGWVFIYELSGCGLDCSCSHLLLHAPLSFKQVQFLNLT